ncbi:TIGR04104 family putative zinc finger protein [Planococcus sp. CAU13]|uniref:TIGR04104 family putative zinc finger protein n=1 Tax=Planococcus sp. CAU13 TaxID=1541197 RepID=UPI00052FFE26|nr:TIGR04104 family putative zinc finger protein [Planococcus sp. CAU13]
MQKCGVCNQSFKWSQLFQSLWFSFRPVTCRNCGTVHRVANASRLLAALLLLVPVIVVFIFMQDSSIVLPLLIIIAAESLLLPFILKYEELERQLDTNNGNR